MLVVTGVAVLAALLYMARPTRDPFRIRARSTGSLVEDDYVAHALTVRKRHATIRHQRRIFVRRLAAHLERCEEKWRASGWRPKSQRWEPLGFRPTDDKPNAMRPPGF
jgi:hypothetical protein